MSAAVMVWQFQSMVDVASAIEKQMESEPTEYGKYLLWKMLGRHLEIVTELQERTRIAIEQEQCSA